MLVWRRRRTLNPDPLAVVAEIIRDCAGEAPSRAALSVEMRQNAYCALEVRGLRRRVVDLARAAHACAKEEELSRRARERNSGPAASRRWST